MPEYEQDFLWDQTKELREKRDKAQRRSEKAPDLPDNNYPLTLLFDKVNKIIARIPLGPESIFTDYNDDDKEVWRKFRRQLISEGIPSETLLLHQVRFRCI